MLEENGLKYIVLRKRNNGLIQRDKLMTGNKAAFDGHFMFNNCAIWYYSYEVEGKRILVYLDSDLWNKEEKDYIRRIEEGYKDYTEAGFMEKQYFFGTIAFRSNIDDTSKKLFQLYKTHGEIEQAFDLLKNLLEQDHIYLQSAYSVETWAFIYHISLLLIYDIYNRLRTADLLLKFSAGGYLFLLCFKNARIRSSRPVHFFWAFLQPLFSNIISHFLCDVK